jgi:hypothetical protein
MSSSHNELMNVDFPVPHCPKTNTDNCNPRFKNFR